MLIIGKGCATTTTRHDQGAQIRAVVPEPGLDLTIRRRPREIQCLAGQPHPATGAPARSTGLAFKREIEEVQQRLKSDKQSQQLTMTARRQDPEQRSAVHKDTAFVHRCESMVAGTGIKDRAGARAPLRQLGLDLTQTPYELASRTKGERAQLVCRDRCQIPSDHRRSAHKDNEELVAPSGANTAYKITGYCNCEQ